MTASTMRSRRAGSMSRDARGLTRIERRAEGSVARGHHRCDASATGRRRQTDPAIRARLRLPTTPRSHGNPENTNTAPLARLSEPPSGNVPIRVGIP